MAAHGAALALLDFDGPELHDEAERLAALGADVLVAPADLREESQAVAAVEMVKRHFGRIDVLVNAAAVLRDAAAVDVTHDDWLFVTDVNLRGTYVMCQQVGRVMIEQGDGAIINVTSIAAHTAVLNRSVYSMTKAAIRSLTQQLAVEWGPMNVRCNSVYFGGIPWTMKGFAPPSEEALEGLPLRRLGTKEEFANVVVFLASDLASYVNGAEIPVDGGRTLTLLAARPVSRPEVAGA